MRHFGENRGKNFKTGAFDHSATHPIPLPLIYVGGTRTVKWWFGEAGSGIVVMRFRLRTLLLIALLAPPLIAALLLYSERTWNEVHRWWIRQHPPAKRNLAPPTPSPQAPPASPLTEPAA
jgi:hypothetical protein